MSQTKQPPHAIQLERFPNEIVDYALDNFNEAVVDDRGREAINTLFEMGHIQVEHGECEVQISQTIIGEVLRTLLMEKLRDIDREVGEGERDDYTIEEINQLMDQVVELSIEVSGNHQ